MEEYEKNILKNINLISEDLVFEIFSFVNLELLVNPNKNYYFKYHKLIKKKINPNRYESYIRSMLRKDNSFTFAVLLNENIDKWKCIVKYYYNHQIFTNYLYFLDFFALENNSTNCRNLIKEKAKAVLGTNWYKKVKVRNCRWKM